MASLDISPEIGRSYQKIVSGPAPNKPSPTYAQWAVFSVSAPLQNAFVQSSKASVLKVHTAGEGELEDLIEEFNDGKVQFAFVKVKDPNTSLAKFALICWCGEGVPERVKGYFTGHLNAVTKVLHGYHVQVTARSESDLSPESIIQKVADASGSKYSSSSAPPPSTAPKPVVAAKPAFQPTRVTGGMLPVGSRAPYKRDEKVDKDGWGEDAPQVTRSQLEKVAPAYKPTKVDINALRAQPTSTTSGFSRPVNDDGQEVVKGGYQPIGKIDIAALRKGYKEERPDPVKGAYQPVDLGSIKKQPPVREPEQQKPVPVAERTSAFNQSERLTSMPKPKVAKKFGPGAPSYGTKPLTPGGFGLGSSPSVPSAPQIGSINKTGITKSPAQIWAEKKARERGLSGASETSPPSISPAATGQHLSPSITGVSAGSHSQQDDDASSSGGVSALRNRFAGNAPMGAAASPQRTGGFSPMNTGDRPPPVDTTSRPSGAAIGGVAAVGGLAAAGAVAAAMPGLPSRPSEPEEEEEDVTPAGIPPPPAQPRSPTPPTPEIPGSPIRIAMPVARSDPVPEIEKFEEPEVSLPTESLQRVVPQEDDLHDEKPVTGAASSGARATVLYDYEATEENEIDLQEGSVVTGIDMVDDDWWMGVNSAGQTGLFPSNYVELVDEAQAQEEAAPPISSRQAEPEPEPVPEPESEPATTYRTAVALYDYEATEENELTFPEGAVIEQVHFPDEDWWAGTYKGQEGLFPANYVELQE
ncbi:hypothetical protein EDC01DRAFT_641447 [Geopyxis carbonaria]|nr:hypothetical protein EDC01DRAFT_641447 [Geopyxis carbonaria]